MICGNAKSILNLWLHLGGFGRGENVASLSAFSFAVACPRSGSPDEFVNGCVQRKAGSVQVIKTVASGAAALDSSSSCFFRVIAGVAFAFAQDSFPY
jgi:hypothetical protein